MISIRVATPADNAQLLDLTERCSMAGRITIRISRRPDYFALIADRGIKTTLLVAESDASGIVGCIGVGEYETKAGNELLKVAYISDLKLDPLQRTGKTLAYLLTEAGRLAASFSPDVYYCLIAEGNSSAITLCRGRLGLPSFNHAGFFDLRHFIARRQQQVRPTSTLEHTRTHTPKHWLHVAEPAGTHVSQRIPIIAQVGSELAQANLVDSSRSKTYSIAALPAMMGICLGLARACLNERRWKIPRLHEPLKQLWLEDLEGDPHRVHEVVARARGIAFDHGATLIGIGIHERDTYFQWVPRSPFTFRSQALIAAAPAVMKLTAHLTPAANFSTI
jgi:hypothetical protein